MNKRPLLILGGSTGIGKTELSLVLAKEFDGEIISCDSMQVYRYMNIGTGKIKPEERMDIPHHLLDIVDPREDFNVLLFQKYAKEAIESVYSRSHLPILVGGTGFYVQSVLYDIDFSEEKGDPSYRETCLEIFNTKGPEALWTLLKEVDPESAEKIPMQNKNRMIRALEFFRENGYPISLHNASQREKESPYDYKYFVLRRDRKDLYARIDRRVDKMMEEGFLDEVAFLREYGCKKEMTSMQALGYKQLLNYLEGNGTLTETIENIKKETRHFAKRQETWYRRERDIVWLDTERGAEDAKRIWLNR